MNTARTAFALSPPAELAKATISARQRAWERWFAQRSLSDRRHDEHDQGRLFRVELWRDYDPHEQQYRFHRSQARFKSLCAGRRGGKTYGAAREFVRRIWEDFAAAVAAGRSWAQPKRWHPAPKPLLHYWAVAPTYALGLIQQRELVEILAPHPELILDWNSDRIWLVGGVLIEFRSADRPDRLVGVGLNGIWIDEAARVKAIAWLDNMRPAISDKQGWALFSTTPLGRNWFWEQIWAKGDAGEPGYANFHFTSAANVRCPQLAAEVEEARRTLPPKYFARNYLASFDAFSGQVYEDLDRRVHMVRPSEVPVHRLRRRVGGGDYGFSNPGVLVQAGVDGDGTWWVYAEDYAKRLPSYVDPPGDCWVKRARAAQKQGISRQWWDPSNPGHIDALASHGVAAYAADNEVNAGIQSVATLLHVRRDMGRPSMLISADCVHLFRELEGYHYETDPTTGTETERVSKVNDHAPDALRYAVHSEAVRGTVPQVIHLSMVR
ncbi:MAG: terminase family protein [Deltaproteobacteria bacterium]|nr:terminase family protein [Deltaproteobacteria bacterium]